MEPHCRGSGQAPQHHCDLAGTQLFPGREPQDFLIGGAQGGQGAVDEFLIAGRIDLRATEFLGDALFETAQPLFRTVVIRDSSTGDAI